MQNSISFGISFPKKVIEKIDEERGDISRSKYLLRIIERVYFENVEKK
jgi:metal-responsive CopG/Arc/MetJ family transcriptional regulator